MGSLADNIVVGGYIPGDSILHRLDPRAKLAGFLFAVAGVFVASSLTSTAMSAVFVIAVAVLCGVGPVVWARGLRRFRWMLAVIAVVNLVFHRHGAPLIAAGFTLPVSAEAVRHAAVFTLQVAGVIVLSMALTFTTTPQQVARGCERLARPLTRVGVPVGELGLILQLAMRFIPVLQLELRATMEAQAARGVDFGSGGLIERGRSLAALFVPALTATLRRADNLAAAMTARGYRPGAPRSEFRPLVFRGGDWAALCLSCVFFLCQALLFR